LQWSHDEIFIKFLAQFGIILSLIEHVVCVVLDLVLQVVVVAFYPGGDGRVVLVHPGDRRVVLLLQSGN
jgi:hypothetical protein